MNIKDIVKLPDQILPGTAACPGCGLQLNLRLTLKVLGKRTVIVIPASCTSIIQGIYPRSAFNVVTINTAIETAASLSSGIVAALEVRKIPDVTVLAWAGDGATFDIGLQALSSVAERNENLLYICYDNEAYMNTGIQRSGATPLGAKTTTTPTGKREHKKDIFGIMYSHHIPYMASGCPSFPVDLVEKVKRAKETKGTRFIHLLSPCPPGWGYPSSMTIKVGKLAVETGIWVLYEVIDGSLKFTGLSKMIYEGRVRRKPIQEYLKMQRRFKGITEEDIRLIEEWVETYWDYLKKFT